MPVQKWESLRRVLPASALLASDLLQSGPAEYSVKSIVALSKGLLILTLTACAGTTPSQTPPTVAPTVALTVTLPPPPTLSPTPTLTPQASVAPSASAEAMAYLEHALDFLQDNGVIRRDKIDWAALRQEAEALAQNAQTPADTYPAIQYVLDQIGDRHGRLVLPDATSQPQRVRLGIGFFVTHPERVIIIVYHDSPADLAGVRVGDVIDAVNDIPAETFSTEQAFYDSVYTGDTVQLTLRRVNQDQPITVMLTPGEFRSIRDPEGHLLDGGLGYLDLPTMSYGGAAATQYANIAQTVIRDADQATTCGWAVDLRRNMGGNMWPMLAGVGPILGEGESGAIVFADGPTQWMYRDGKALSGSETIIQVDKPYQLKTPLPPVAVLTSRYTVSSGEAIVVAFRGRPNTRSFGEATVGAPAAPDAEKLSDGAQLFISVAPFADRTGQIYDDVILPDQPMEINWIQLGIDQDPVLNAATEWLRNQPACANQ